jgi:hypothetical protein
VADDDEESETGSEGEGNDHNQWGGDGGNMAFDKHWTHVVGKIAGEDAGDETSDDEMGDGMGRPEKGSDEEQ